MCVCVCVHTTRVTCGLLRSAITTPLPQNITPPFLRLAADPPWSSGSCVTLPCHRPCVGDSGWGGRTRNTWMTSDQAYCDRRTSLLCHSSNLLFRYAITASSSWSTVESGRFVRIRWWSATGSVGCDGRGGWLNATVWLFLGVT